MSPGSVANAAPTTVLPWSLSKTFVHSREYPLIENEYRDGSSQRCLEASTSRKSWRTSRRLAPVVLSTFRTFFNTHKGPHLPLYFYDPSDTSPKFWYDPTGVATVGRYAVRFVGTWEQMVGINRADVNIAIIEIA